MGRSTVDGYNVYGKYYAYGTFGPTNLPRSVFVKNKDVLEEIEIDKGWLLKKTGNAFPTSFKTTELYTFDFDVTVQIARLLGIDYIKSKNPSTKEQSALRRAIINKLDAL